MHVVDAPGPALASSTSAKGYIVQVSDSSGVPVAGAAVSLRLPEDSPTGRFAGDLRAWVTYTDSAGVARFPAIRWGENPGFVELRATAAKGNAHAGLLIQQQVKADGPAQAAAPVVPQTTIVIAPVTVPQPPAAPRIAEPIPQPATVFEPIGDIAPPPTAAKSGAAAPKQALKPNPPPPQVAAAPEKIVSIVNLKTGAGGSSGRSNKKWIILAAVGTGAGVGALLALKGHAGSGTTTSPSTGISIGTPTVSVGH
jgi:hypothetical protein